MSAERLTTSLEYQPSPEQLERLQLLKTLVEGFEKYNIRYAIVGGYGLDGLYGALTRDHDDIDLLVDDEQRNRAKVLLNELGLRLARDKGTGVEVFDHVPTSTKVEVVGWDTLAAFTKEHDLLFMPSLPNAHLGEFVFTTSTLSAHKFMDEIQAHRATQLNWGEYPHRESKNKLFEILSKKERTS